MKFSILQEKVSYFEVNMKVPYMSLDRFLLAVESRDLSQVDKSIKRVSSFPKLSEGWQNFLFCLSTTEAWTFCKINALNPLRFTPLTRKTEKNVYFSILQSLNDKIVQNINFAKLPVPNDFFGLSFKNCKENT